MACLSSFDTDWIPGRRASEKESLDWYYALNGYQFRVEGRKTFDENGNVVTVAKVSVYKRYNWGTEEEDRKDLHRYGVTLRQEDMAHLPPPNKLLKKYHLYIPGGATQVSHLEDNDWSSQALFLKFQAPKQDMDKFLEHIRADPAKMAKGYYVPESEKPGWKKKPGHTYRNQTSTWQPGSGALGYKFTIDITNRSRPEIYLLALIV